MFRQLVLKFLALFQEYRRLSPPACRYLPTCTAYSVEAIERYGVLRGVSMALRRISRCHPWGASGHDPVPTSGQATQHLKRVVASQSTSSNLSGPSRVELQHSHSEPVLATCSRNRDFSDA